MVRLRIEKFFNIFMRSLKENMKDLFYLQSQCSRIILQHCFLQIKQYINKQVIHLCLCVDLRAVTLTEMGMLDCADLCCQVTNRFSIFICFSISVSTVKAISSPLRGVIKQNRCSSTLSLREYIKNNKYYYVHYYCPQTSSLSNFDLQ